jgi:hypothetical protein
MGRFDDRLRRLEARLRDRSGPSLEEVRHAWERIAASARTKVRGEPTGVEQAARDRVAVAQWIEEQDVDMESVAERARQKLINVGRSRQ